MMAEEHEDRAKRIETTIEWKPLRRPGGLLAAMCFFASIALVTGYHSALSATVVFVSVPIVLLSARRKITIALYGTLTFALHLTYWLTTGAKDETRAGERVLVAGSELCLIASFAASWFFPHQYAVDPRKDWRFDQFSGDCGLPFVAPRTREEGGEESVDLTA